MEEKNPFISVVSPVYGCSTSLVELYMRLTESLKKISETYEIILVNDASPDGAWEVIVKLCEKDSRVKGLNLSRNFGQHHAITAGLEFAKGEWIVVMDCDLQDRPEEILNLYNKAIEGYDMVLGRREIRKDSVVKRFFSGIFYWVFSYLTLTKQDKSVANFGIYSRPVIKSLLSMNDKYRAFALMIQWVGFVKTYIPVKHENRTNGKSSYNFRKSINLALNAMIAFSDRPLKITIKVGFVTVVLSSLFILYKIINSLLFGYEIIGWASLIASIFFSTGIIITVLGVLGLYIGRIFEEVKNRPIYLIRNKINIE